MSLKSMINLFAPETFESASPNYGIVKYVPNLGSHHFSTARLSQQ